MANVLRVSLNGVLPGGEVWSVNPVFHLLDTPAVSAPQCLTIANAINVITWSTGITNQMSAATTVTGTRVEARAQATGALEAQADSPRSVAVPGLGANIHALQTSLVASLRSDFPGARGRGRLYFPATAATLVTATHRVSASGMNGFVLGVKTLLAAVQSAIQPTLGPNSLIVWSRTAGAVHAVTQIRAGDVLDVQRRRRDQLVEQYYPVSYP